MSIYKITQLKDISKDYGLIDQMRRASVSIASNIAEGDERKGNKESIRFFYIALGSIAELITQLTIAYEINYIDEVLYNDLVTRLENLSKKIKTLVRYRNNTKNPKPNTQNLKPNT